MQPRPKLVRLGAVLVLALCSVAAAQIRPGRWDQKRKIPEGWEVYNSRHYQIQSQVGKDKAKRLAGHMEAMLAVYVKLFKPDKSLSTKRYPIKLFESRRLFISYGKAPGAAAYYSRSAGEMVCYDTGRWMDEVDAFDPTSFDPADYASIKKRMGMDLLGVAAHEGWHQYFAWYVGSWVSLPSWINEGMGDYFYTAAPKSKGSGRKKAELGRMNDARLPVIRRAVNSGNHVPLDRFVHYTQSDYYSNASICYAQGWAFCQFLLHGKNRKWKKIIPNYIKYVRSDTNMRAVTARSFKGVDFAKMEEEFLAWLKTQKLPIEIARENARKAGNKGRPGHPTTGSGAGNKGKGTKSGGGEGRER